MDKKILSRLLVPLAVLTVAVFWLLTYLDATAAAFRWFSLAWGVFIVLAALGAKYLLAGILSKGANVVLRKWSIAAGSVFLVLAFVCLTLAIAVPENIVVPIIAIILAAGVFFAVLFTGGRKWDAGDNQKAGYKTYAQRKAEEAKNQPQKVTEE